MVHAETWLNGEEASNYFNIEISDQVEAVACISEYFNHYKNTPKHLLNNQNTNTIKDDASLQKQKLKLQLDLM
jgi:hypothetical protein